MDGLHGNVPLLGVGLLLGRRQTRRDQPGIERQPALGAPKRENDPEGLAFLAALQTEESRTAHAVRAEAAARGHYCALKVFFFRNIANASGGACKTPDSGKGEKKSERSGQCRASKMEPKPFPAVSAATPPSEERRVLFLDTFDYGIHISSARLKVFYFLKSDSIRYVNNRETDAFRRGDRSDRVPDLFFGFMFLALEFSARLAFNSYSKGFRYDIKTANHARWRLSKMMSGVPGIRTSAPTRPDRAPAGSDEVS